MPKQFAILTTDAHDTRQILFYYEWSGDDPCIHSVTDIFGGEAQIDLVIRHPKDEVLEKIWQGYLDNTKAAVDILMNQVAEIEKEANYGQES